jgi:NIMA (never in mitosis gene a)-related kinase
VLQHTYDCANTAIGTPYYLSPEICQEKPYNQKSDIWSLGCIFYEIATLNHAFDAQNMKGLVQKILKGTYPPLPEVYSSDLKKLLSEMLIKDPNKRPSIKKILEMPFMKAKINELFSSTIKIHELKLEKENTCNKSDLLGLERSKPEEKKSSK